MSVILIADDNPHAHRMGKQILSQEGFDVVTASDGDEAMRYLDQNRPDLVMVDTRMPGPNGYEICEHVKAAGTLAGVRVVLLAGPLEPFDPTEAERVGSDAVLHKPLDAYTLIETVKSLVEKPQPNVEREAEPKEQAGTDSETDSDAGSDTDAATVAAAEGVEETAASPEDEAVPDVAIEIPDPDDYPKANELAETDEDSGETEEVPVGEPIAVAAAASAAPAGDDPLADLVDMALGTGVVVEPPAPAADPGDIEQAVREALDAALPSLVEAITQRVIARLDEK